MDFVKQFYQNIDRLISSFNNNFPPHIAVGVSGGADSMCLVHLLNIWAKDKQIKITALIVNHNLRAEAKCEAELVQKRLNELGIENFILTNDSKKPNTGIQNYARQVRYELMWNWCIDNNVKCLSTAHHYDDLLETIGIRLEKSSKSFGLAGINALQNLANGCLIRPLLHFIKEQLIQYCGQNNICYVNDPSNKNEDFSRVRIRNKISKDTNYKQELIDIHNKNLAIRQDIEKSVIRLQKKYCTQMIGGFVKIDLKLLDEKEQDVFYTIRQIIMWVRGDFAPPRTEKLNNLVTKLLKPKFSGATLNGCCIKILQKNIWVYMELKHIEQDVCLSQINIKNPYMDRYYLAKPNNKNLTITTLRNNNDINLDNIYFPKSILNSVICVYEGKKLIYTMFGKGINDHNLEIIDNKWNLFHTCPFIY